MNSPSPRRKYERDYKRNRYATDPAYRETILARNRANRVRNKANWGSERYVADQHLERRYNLTRDEWNQMLTAQGGVCAICETDTWGGSKNVPCVDHDHATGVVRALLCHSCNAGLGRFRDDSALLKRAAEYLDADWAEQAPQGELEPPVSPS